MPPQPHHDSPSGPTPTAAGDAPTLSAAERAALAQGTEESAQHSLDQSAAAGAVHSDASLSPFAPLSVPVFRMLWLTWVAANTCMWMNDVAAAWLMTTLTTSPVLVALVQSASTLPVFLLGLPSGALADILDRRRYFMATQFWVAAVAVVLAFAIVSGGMSAPLLLALTFANGIGLAMRWPVFAAIVPELVSRPQLPAALALNGVAMNASRIVGPLLAGAIIASAGSAWVFVLNAVLSVLSGLVIMRWKREHIPSPLGRERLPSAMRVGVQFVRQSPRMRAVLWRISVFFLHATALMALLPLVESALNPHAQSPVGATGTWQFMAPTARRFALRTSRLVDDRKNFQRATAAALDYLQKLHEQFGDWHLAMAAYNWGEGRVQMASDRLRRQGVTPDFDAMSAAMPIETRNYVPQIDALVRLVADPARYAANLPDAPDSSGLVTVGLALDMDLALALKFSGLSQARFLALNPAVRPPLLLAAATPRLWLPPEAAERFDQALSDHAGRLASWSIYRLPQTEAVDSIARRYGLSLAEVRAANAIPPGMKPIAGSVLLLPMAARDGIPADPATIASASLSLAPDIVRGSTRVRKGENLAAIARRCDVDLADLTRWNHLGGKARVRGGQSLVLWVGRERAGALDGVWVGDVHQPASGVQSHPGRGAQEPGRTAQAAGLAIASRPLPAVPSGAAPGRPTQARKT